MGETIKTSTSKMLSPFIIIIIALLSKIYKFIDRAVEKKTKHIAKR